MFRIMIFKDRGYYTICYMCKEYESYSNGRFSNITEEISCEHFNNILALLADKKKVDAIRFFRSRCEKFGLLDSKRIIEYIEEHSKMTYIFYEDMK